MNTTACEICSREVPDDKIQKCVDCGLDGLCGRCAAPDQHDCEGEGE